MSAAQRIPRRAAGVLLAAAVAVVAGLVAPALALEEEGFTLHARETVEKDYPPIPASEPATVTVGGVVGPDECAALPSCALVKIDMEAPTELEPGDDFYVVLEISWVYASGAEDLDVYLFDDGQTHAAEGGDGSVYTEKGSSASADNPEKIQIYEPLLGTYNLVVQSFSGVATAWHLKAQSIVGEFTPPIESLAPAPGSGTRNTTTTTTSTTAPASPTASTSTTVSIPEGVVLPDDDFEDGGFDPSGPALDEQLAASEQLSGGRNADSPSAMTVLLWMVGLPLVLVGPAAYLIVRRRTRLRAA